MKKVMKVILVVAFLAGLVGVGIYVYREKFFQPKFDLDANGEVIIPSGYTRTVGSDYTQTDGANTTYYVYKDRIIAVSTQNYPAGSPYVYEYIATLYDNLDGAFINNFNGDMAGKHGAIIQRVLKQS